MSSGPNKRGSSSSSSSRLSPFARPYVANHSINSRVDHLYKDRSVPFSIPQGKVPAEEFKPCVVRSDSFYGKFIGTSRIDNEVVSKDTMRMSFPITSKCSTTIHGDPQSGLAFSITSSSSDSIITSYERRFSQPLYSYASRLKLSCASEHSSAVQIPGPSGAGTVVIEDPNTPLNTAGNDALHEFLIKEGQEVNNGNTVTSEIIDPITKSKSEPQVTFPTVPHDLTLNLPGVEEGDSDLDSPCWKGTLAVNQSALEDFGPVNSQHLKSGQEVLNNLNPLGSKLFASSDKQNFYRVNDCDGDNSLFFHRTASSANALPSVEQRSANSVTARSSFSELKNFMWSHCPNDICAPDKEDIQLKKSSRSSMLNFSCSLEPSYAEDFCYSNTQLMTGPNVAGSMRGRDAIHHGATRISFESKNVFSSSSSYRVCVPSDFTEIHEGATRSFSTPPRLDIQKVLITMNKLSELLLHDCSNDLDSLNEHEYNIIEHIINNLTVCIRNRIGRRTLMSESSHPCTSYCQKKSADLLKCSTMVVEAPRTKAMSVSHSLGYEYGHDKQKTYFTNSSERPRDYFSTSKDERTEKDEYISQVIEKDVAKDHEIKDVNPRVLLYKNLLLEAEAARRFF